MSKKYKIRWAFDPFSDHEDTWQRAVEVLSLISNQSIVEITPTYVIGSEITDWVANAYPNQGSDIVSAVQKLSASFLKKIDQKHLFKEAEIIHSSAISKRTDAKTLVDSLEGYDLLVLNTHARKGLKRLFMGSFAENVLLKSKIPMIFVSPHTTKIQKLDHFFFPTDLSDSSKGVFQTLIENNFGLAKKISLYSRISHPSSAFLTSASALFGGPAISLEQHLGHFSNEYEKKMKHWKESFSHPDIPIHSTVDSSAMQTSEAIIHNAEAACADIIAMPSFSNKIDTLVAGSITREVIRASTLPVLVWHKVKTEHSVTVI